ncbi:MAG: cell division protein ZapA [Acidobacteriota bacterium]
MATKSIDIEIFGSTYHVRAEQDREYLQELAASVDRKMREIAGSGSKVDPGRVAVLAALNLADELFRQQRLREGERVNIEETAARLAEALASALGSAAEGSFRVNEGQ